MKEQEELNKIIDFEDEKKVLEILKNNIKFKNKCNILIVGFAGVGKSTLLNKMFGKDLAEAGIGEAVTNEITLYPGEEYPINIYDTPGCEGDEKGWSQKVRGHIEKMNSNEDPLLHIHAVWYLVNLPRFLEHDNKSIRETFLGLPVFLILNKADLAKNQDDINSFFSDINPITKEKKKFSIQDLKKEGKIVDYFQVFCLKEKVPVETDICPKCFEKDVSLRKKTMMYLCHECNHTFESLLENQACKLIEKTLEVIPKQLKNGFIMAQKISTDLKIKRCLKEIGGFSIAAAAIGATPLPFADIIPITGTQVAMFVRIASFWGITISKQFSIKVLTGLLSQFILSFGGLTLASYLKVLPGVGTALGCFFEGAIAGSITFSLGSFNLLVFYLLWMKYGDLSKVHNLEEIIGKTIKNLPVGEILKNFTNSKISVESYLNMMKQLENNYQKFIF